jgi:hypothetical protein
MKRLVRGTTKLKFCMHCHSAQWGRTCEQCRRPTIPDPNLTNKRFPRLASKPKREANKFYCLECDAPQADGRCFRHGTTSMVEYTASMKRARQIGVRVFSSAFEQGKRS